MIRIRNAALGGYDRSFLGYSLSRGTLFQNWISGEILADDRLEDAMNIDRRTLRIAHPAYVELQRAVHDHLQGLIKRVRAEIYGSRSQARRKQRARMVERRIVDVASQEITAVDPVAALHVKEAWQDATQDQAGQKKLLRTLAVDELYRLVIDVAEEILTKEQLAEFLTRLTDRLQR